MGKDEELPAEIKDPAIRGIADRLHEKIERDWDIASDAQKKAAEVHAVTIKEPQQLCFPMTPMPTDMCRVSPFFPQEVIKLLWNVKLGRRNCCKISNRGKK